MAERQLLYHARGLVIADPILIENMDLTSWGGRYGAPFGVPQRSSGKWVIWV